MIIAPDFVYIHLQKCGGSFVREYLTKHIPGAKYSGTVHDSVRDIPRQYRGKHILGTIRNPWDWYLSWYASTQRSKSGLFWLLHKNGKQTTFTEFMATIFSLKNKIHNIDFGLVSSFGIGIYTYRYIQSYCHNPSRVLKQLQSQSLIDNTVSKIHFCRTENLRLDLMNFLITTPTGITESQKKELTTMDKVNTSKSQQHKNEYSEQLIQLVKVKDRYIVNRFGYVPETKG